MERGSGILLHITSLPGADVIGNMGPGAVEFVNFLIQTGQSYWQVLPLNPASPGEGNSPYSSLSAFAGNILFLSPESLAEEGLIAQNTISNMPDFSKDRVDFQEAIRLKQRISQEASSNFRGRGRGDNYDRFCEENGYWLTDFAHFTALKEHYGNVSWSDWPAAIRDRQPDALEVSKREFAERIEREKIFQFLFYRQWMSLKNYCRQNHIRIIGDLPIYLSNQSADVWAHPEIFKLDANKKPTHISGVPPDYFSKTGQLWGNPVYNWEKLAESDFQWWLKRIEHNLKLFDILRIDHFRGLVAYWEVAAGEKTAINGRWVNVPVTSFFERLRQHCPYLPLIAEDLGVITPDVQEVIKQLDIPGMKVLLFAFGDNLADNPYAPHNHVKKCVVYTGTHDNSTIKGWFEKEATADEKGRLTRYLGKEVSADEISWDFIRMAMMSVADTAIIPMQHILGLGDEARMNIPSTVEGNWEWRLNADRLTSSLKEKLRDITEISGRFRR